MGTIDCQKGKKIGYYIKSTLRSLSISGNNKTEAVGISREHKTIKLREDISRKRKN